MQATIKPGNISGSVAAPASKSITQRVYAGALLRSGKTLVQGAGSSGDELAALGVIKALGAAVSAADGVQTIISNGIDKQTGVLHHNATAIHCGESGLCARLFMPIAALSDRTITITAEGSLLTRPMHIVAKVLPQLGVAVTTTNGCLPATVSGKLAPGDIAIDGSQGSQFLSGLLFAYCFAHRGAHTITVQDLKSKPYIDMTLAVLKQFGYTVTHNNYTQFCIGANDFYKPVDDMVVTVEGDWSSAAYFLVAGAIAGSIKVKGLVNNSVQADSALLPLLQSIGAKVAWEDGMLCVQSSRLRAFDFDATDCPDLFPVLAILAACCEGESSIKGVRRLFHKESNRAESIAEMLENFAVPYAMEDDTLYITGVRKLQGTVIDSYHDHRIAMAAAIGALRAGGPVDILHASAVRKSYPGFFEDLISCGVNCNLEV